MGYKEEMTAFAGRLGVRALGELSLKELAERIDSRPEPTTPRTQLYAFMTWLSDHLLEVNSSDEGSFSREIATWCLFVNKAGYDSGNVVGTFEGWLFEHRQVEPSSTERLNMAEREVKKFYSLPTAAPHRFVSAGEHDQPSPPPEKTFQQFSSVNEASEAQPIDGFGQIHPDRLKLSRYSDSNPEKGEVIDLDDWQRPVVDISSDEDADPKAKNNLSFLTGANRMVFGDDETNLTTDLQEKMKKKKRSKTQTMQSGPNPVQPKRKNKNPCGRCGVPGHYHTQCPTNLDPLFDKSPPNEYKCNYCNRYGDHYATVCKRNTHPTSLTQQRKRYAEQRRQFHPRRSRSSSPLREPKDKRHIARERSPHREPKDRHHYNRESSPYRESETRYHIDRDRSRERRRSRERYRRRRSRSRSRSHSPPRQALRRRDNHRAKREYRLKHSSPEPSFREPELSSPPQFGALDYDEAFEHMPGAPYRPLISRSADVNIRGRGSSFYYDDNAERSTPASAYVNESLMPRMTDRWSMVDAYRQDGVLQVCHSRPHQDDNVDRPSLDKGFLLTELTDLIASTTVSPLARAPMKNRLPEVFKNDLRQSSGSWVIEPTINTTWIKPEPVPDVVREPSPPVELGVTEKRIDGHRSTQYHPAVLELFKNRKNVWLHKVDKATRAQASSFFWDKDPEEDDMDVSADADADAGLESARDTVMTEAEPVAPAVTDADIVALVNSEAEPVAMLTDGPQRANSTPAIDVVMENHMTMQIPYRDEDEVRTHQPGGDGRVGFKPAVDVVMEDAEPLDASAAVDVPEAVDVSAIVDKIIADIELSEAAKTASEPVENKSPSVQFTTSSETLNAPETVNHTLVERADIVREVEPEHATTADNNDHDNGTLKAGTQDIGDSVSSDTVIKDVIYVKTDPEPAETEPSQPEEQADITVLDGSQAH